MKTIRCLVPVLGVAAIFAFVSFAADKPQTASSAPAPTCAPAYAAPTAYCVNGVAQPHIMREILDAHPDLIQWLLDRYTSNDLNQQERAYFALSALSALVPVAGEEFFKALENPKPAVRMAAMSFLASGARQSPDFPLNKAVTLLLKIAQDENEDDQIRKMATISVCEIICIIQGQPFSAYMPQGG